MSLRVLIVADFDPAGVCLSHRNALRQVHPEVDIRVALHTCYGPMHEGADYKFLSFRGISEKGQGIFEETCSKEKVDELMVFARSADVIQVCPGIGQPWGGKREGPADNMANPPTVWYFERDWKEILKNAPARVAYFHGSVHTWTHLEEYRALYTRLGYILSTSTLDYACEMPAAYLPPYIDAGSYGERAALRHSDDPLVVAHTPTDPSIASTAEFLALAKRLGISVIHREQVPHAQSIEAKRNAHAVFDHLRGSFSVNTLEACALGCAPLVGLKRRYADRLMDEGFDDFPGWVEDLKDLEVKLIRLRDDPEATRDLQHAAYKWVRQNLNASIIGERMFSFYSGQVPA